jgi:hypothetical protein
MTFKISPGVYPNSSYSVKPSTISLNTQETKGNEMFTFKFGRTRPKYTPPLLRFGNYLKQNLPIPPDSVNYIIPSVLSSLNMILDNDKIGDCTAAGAMHIENTFRANANSGLPFATTQQAINFYSDSTGYNPDDPTTDQGGNEIDVLNYWRQYGLFRDGTAKISAYLSIDATNQTELKAAIWLAENLYFGVELPDAWLKNFPGNGFTWDVAGEPNPKHGHCFVGLGYDSKGVIIDSWGYIGKVTWAAIAKYADLQEGGQVFTVISQDIINKITGLAPTGLDYTQLVADIDSLI